MGRRIVRSDSSSEDEEEQPSRKKSRHSRDAFLDKDETLRNRTRNPSSRKKPQKQTEIENDIEDSAQKKLKALQKKYAKLLMMAQKQQIGDHTV